MSAPHVIPSEWGVGRGSGVEARDLASAILTLPRVETPQRRVSVTATTIRPARPEVSKERAEQPRLGMHATRRVASTSLIFPFHLPISR